MMSKAEVNEYAAKFFNKHDFFPIDVNFGDKEKIRIVMRPKKHTSEILDVYSNGTHIGMLVGIEKTGDVLKIGPGGLNKYHQYRNILSFIFAKLLEYYGLDGVKAIVVDAPENLDFYQFLSSLGLIEKNKKLIIELEGDKAKSFFSKLEQAHPEILSQVGQIESLIRINLGNDRPERVTAAVDKIVDKIKNMDPLGKKFWDNRKVAQINVFLSAAMLFPNRLVKDEFLEVSIKTIITSFDTYVRAAYLEDLLQALDGVKIFSMPYIQAMVDKIRVIVPDQIKKLNRDHLRHWISQNMPAWKIADKTAIDTINKTIADSKLKIEDFGSPIKEEIKGMVSALVAHFNGENIFYGVNNRL